MAGICNSFRVISIFRECRTNALPLAKRHSADIRAKLLTENIFTLRFVYKFQSCGEFHWKCHHSRFRQIQIFWTVFFLLSKDLARLTASIDKYTKEVERIKSEELLQNLKKFKEATRELNFLKSEIQRNEKIEALNTYMRLKDLELERSKTFQKMTHVNKINSIYHVEVSNYQNALSHSVQILQDKFLVLRSLNEIDNKLLDNLAHLGRLLLGQRSVKFADGKASNTSECSNFEGISDIQNIMNLTDFGSDETSSSPVSAKKRANEDLETEKESKKSKPSVDFPFARPKAVQSINFNSASTLKAPNNNHDMNITFNLEQNQCSSSSLPALVERSNKVSSVKTAPSALKCKKLQHFATSFL